MFHRIFESGISRQIFATLTATLSIFISGMWMGWPSSVVEKFIRRETDFDADIDQLSWIVSSMDLGNVLSPLFAGYLMDRIGRKPSLVVLGPLFTTTWLLTLYVPTAWSLYTARLLAGVGKGMSYTVVPVFLGEISGANVRGALSSVFCLQLHLGFALEAVVGPLVSYRTLNVVSAFFPVAFLLLAFWIPESPYYLLKKNRPSEAARCLRWYRCDRGDDAVLNAELRQMEARVKQEMENESTFGELFSSRKDLSALMVVVTACACQRAGGISCILSYSSVILPDPSPIVDKSGYVMAFAATLVAVNFAGAAAVDRVGRKPLLIASELGMGVITSIFGFYFYMQTERFTWLPYACFVSFAAIFATGSGFVPVVLLGELFPVNVRSHCSAVASVTLAACSFVTNKMFLLVSRRFGFHVMFAMFAVVNFAGATYAYLCAIETKGKTLLEIQELLEANVKSGRKPEGGRVVI